MKIKNIITCIVLYAFFPLSSILMKFASEIDVVFYKILLYGSSLVTLFIFSLFWQKVLKKVPLIQAYIFKSTTLLWNLLYGYLIFAEKVKINMVIGIIIAGIGIFIILNRRDSNENN